MTMAPVCSVIVPVFNKAVMFRRSAASIAEAAARSGAELIFVDHGSTDGAREVAAGIPGAIVLDHRGGTVASVRNVGARAAHGRLLCFLDSDVTVPTDYFERVAAAFERTGAGAVGYECAMPADEGWLARTWHALNAVPGEGARWYINAANIAVSRTAFDAVGGWNGDLISAEEVDLCRRLRRAGLQVWAAPELAAVHLDNPRSLSAFFRKQVWHGMGMPATDGRLISNRVMTMAAAHVGLLVLAVLVTFLPNLTAGARLVWVVMLAMAVPTLSWAYRVWQTKRWTNPLLATVLFQAYFLARATSLPAASRARSAGSVRRTVGRRQ